jgi:hypothetical protein
MQDFDKMNGFKTMAFSASYVYLGPHVTHLSLPRAKVQETAARDNGEEINRDLGYLSSYHPIIPALRHNKFKDKAKYCTMDSSDLPQYYRCMRSHMVLSIFLLFCISSVLQRSNRVLSIFLSVLIVSLV